MNLRAFETTFRVKVGRRVHVPRKVAAGDTLWRERPG